MYSIVSQIQIILIIDSVYNFIYQAKFGHNIGKQEILIKNITLFKSTSSVGQVNPSIDLYLLRNYVMLKL